MAMPDKMAVELTPAQKTTIVDGFNLVLTTLNGVKIVQLTAEERKGAQSASETRFPYMQNAIENLAPQFPNLQLNDLPLADAQKDMTTSLDMRQINLLVAEVNDRFIDFAMASEHFAYEYMLAFYNNAKRARKNNTPGADTVVNALAPLFEGQGNSGGESPNP